MDSGQHPGPAASKTTVGIYCCDQVHKDVFQTTTAAMSSQSVASNAILPNQTARSRQLGRNDIGEYHRRADELWKELSDIKGKKDEILKTAYKYQCAKGTMNAAAAVKQDDVCTTECMFKYFYLGAKVQGQRKSIARRNLCNNPGGQQKH